MSTTQHVTVLPRKDIRVTEVSLSHAGTVDLIAMLARGLDARGIQLEMSSDGDLIRFTVVPSDTHVWGRVIPE